MDASYQQAMVLPRLFYTSWDAIEGEEVDAVVANAGGMLNVMPVGDKCGLIAPIGFCLTEEDLVALTEFAATIVSGYKLKRLIKVLSLELERRNLETQPGDKSED